MGFDFSTKISILLVFKSEKFTLFLTSKIHSEKFSLCHPSKKIHSIKADLPSRINTRNNLLFFTTNYTLSVNSTSNFQVILVQHYSAFESGSFSQLLFCVNFLVEGIVPLLESAVKCRLNSLAFRNFKNASNCRGIVGICFGTIRSGAFGNTGLRPRFQSTVNTLKIEWINLKILAVLSLSDLLIQGPKFATFEKTHNCVHVRAL
jgi:hypothetical protein